MIKSRKLKDTFVFLKVHLLNGVFAYSIFGIYALTITPLIADFFEYETQNFLLSFLGFVLLTAEFFAFKFKLKMIRFRAYERRLAIKNKTGIDEIPKISKYLLFEFFFRLVFRFLIIMFSINALGISTSEKDFSQYGGIIGFICLIVDILGLMHLYLGSGLDTDPPRNDYEEKEEINDQEKWRKANIIKGEQLKYYKYEAYSDIVLQIYSIAIYTVFWKILNQTGIKIVQHSIIEQESITEAAISLFFFLAVFVFLGLTPIRITYWIEDSLMAVTRREIFFTRLTFGTVAIFTCSPSIITFISIYFFNIQDFEFLEQPEYVGYLISLVLFVFLTVIQIIFYRSQKSKKSL